MDRQQALKLVSDICSSVKLTWQEHQTVQQALNVLKEEKCEPKE